MNRARLLRILGRVGLWTAGVLVTLALVATGLVVWSVRRAFPDVSGELSLPGLSAPVTVYRDQHGIPQLYAKTAADLFRAQGYVHAQDRFWEMDFRRHVTSGRLSELFGEGQVSTDAFLRTLGWRQVAEQEWTMVSATAKAYLEAYAAGVNAWIAANGGADASGAKSLEYTILGLSNGGYQIEPWSPVDSLAWLKAMAWDLRGNMESETDRAVLLASGLTVEQVDDLYPGYPYERNAPIVDGGTVVEGAFTASVDEPASFAMAKDIAWSEAAPALSALSAAVAALPQLMGDGGPGIGSNSWVIAGSHTASGKPMLANDPHLSPSMPGIWYQMGLHCDCEYNVAGFTFSGVPGVVIGHTDRIAWGFTNLDPDVTDLYLEKVEGDRVFDGTQWIPLTTRQETIQVAGGEPVTITVRSTKHGPLVSDRSKNLLTAAGVPPVEPSGSPRPAMSPTPEPTLDTTEPGVPSAAKDSPYAVALRWTALDPGHTVEALFAINQITDWDSFREAAAGFEVPSQNIVYADVDGNIGYQSPGRIPVRGKGDGRWPAPGWDPSYDWTGFIPFAELPNVLNPDDGWIVTANQAVIGRQYQHVLTRDWDFGYRSQRIMEMCRARIADGKIDAEAIRQMQFDNRNGFAPTLVPRLLPIKVGGPVPAAIDLLRTWDFQQSADSAAAAFYNTTWRHLLLRTFDELPDGLKPDGGSRWFEVMRRLLADPSSPWWDVRDTATVESRDDILGYALTDGYTVLHNRVSKDPSQWKWGDLHTLSLENATFGKSGVGPIEWLFNVDPAGVSGGDAIVNATGWDAGVGYEVDAVPSMRMIVDLSNLDESRWIQLTGNSGHAFHSNYSDQFEMWRTGQNLPMRWNRGTIESESTDTLTLKP